MTNQSKPELNPNAKLWVEALRSGKYKQDKGFLQTQEGYCCLGVACMLYEKQTSERFSRGGEIIRGGRLDGEFAKVREWLQLKESHGGYCICNIRQSLANLNDAGETFEEIADIIESQPKGLFTND